MKRLAVYCGSATPADPALVEIAREMGQTLAERGIGLVYGGGRLGLMGALADAALAAGGAVTGVIPQALVDIEVAHRGLTDLRIVRGMHDRKALFAELSDGFVTLPGGAGTMDEFWEAISWAQLGYHAAPVGLLNAGGFYDPLIAMWQRMVETGFVRARYRDLLVIAEHPGALVDAMARHVPARPIIQLTGADL